MSEATKVRLETARERSWPWDILLFDENQDAHFSLLYRFHHHIVPQAMTPSTPVLGSGTVAKNPWIPDEPDMSMA
jgi:hypothetical protein